MKKIKKYILLFIFLVAQHVFAQPTITSFSPASGRIGSTVTIVGTNFSAVTANNIVYFGATKAIVNSATTTSLTVKVPVGVTHQPITVTSNGLTAYSILPFTVTFASDSLGFTANSFDTGLIVNHYEGETAISDLDGDGKPDLIEMNDSSLIYKNTGQIGVIDFAPAVSTPGQHSGGTTIAVADFDGDGKQDIVTNNYNLGDQIVIYRNTSSIGNISFAEKITLSGYATGILVADINGDGKPDIITINGLFGAVAVYKNTSQLGDISFDNNGPVYPIFFGYINFAIGDLDGDGLPDLLLVSDDPINPQASVYRNNSVNNSISFEFAYDLLYPGFSQPDFNFPKDIAIGDLDSDGKLDVALAGSKDSLRIFRNNSIAGTISFDTIRVLVKGREDPGRILIEDLDGDGRPDITTSNGLYVYKNMSDTGLISFADGIRCGQLANDIDINNRHFSSGDLDGDGKPDLVDGTLDHLTVFRNKKGDLTKICPGNNMVLISNFAGTSYQWQLNTGNGFQNIMDDGNYTGSNTNTLQINNIPSSWYSYQYRTVVDGVNTSTLTLQFSSSWTGAVNIAWENPANWSCGVVPDGNTDVFIDSGFVILSSITSIRSLTMSPGVSFIADPGSALTIKH